MADMTEHKPEAVEQIDCDAAADLIEKYWAGSDAAMLKLAASYRAGHSNGAFVRAFARHRIAALTPAQPATPALMDEVREALELLVGEELGGDAYKHSETSYYRPVLRWVDRQRARALLAKLPPKATTEGGEG